VYVPDVGNYGNETGAHLCLHGPDTYISMDGKTFASLMTAKSSIGHERERVEREWARLENRLAVIQLQVDRYKQERVMSGCPE
jgi:hypothetical protein